MRTRTRTGPLGWLNGRLVLMISVLATLSLLLTACPDDEPDEPADEPADDPAEEPADEPDEPEDDPDEEPADEPEDVPDEPVQIGWIPWEENIAVMNLWAEILEEEGYNVELTQLEVAPVFAGVAGGDIDLFHDVWLDDTHATYWEDFSDDFVDMGVWYEPATLELTVPTYVVDEHGIESLEDLADNADLFDGQITGIEAGAGMMELLRESVMPTYGLDEDFTLLESSTAAMRADLQAAYDNEEPIVVTLWTPHPEYGLKDLTRLEDPEGAWGTEERIHAIARDGFEDDFPQVAEWTRNFEMSEEELASLNAAIEEAGDGEERDVAREWIDENRDVVDGWLGR